MEFCNLYCLSDSRESKKTDTMHVNEGNLEEITDWKMGRKESIRKVCVNILG